MQAGGSPEETPNLHGFSPPCYNAASPVNTRLQPPRGFPTHISFISLSFFWWLTRKDTYLSHRPKTYHCVTNTWDYTFYDKATKSNLWKP